MRISRQFKRALESELRRLMEQGNTELKTRRVREAETLRDKFLRVAKAMGLTKDLGSLVMNINRKSPGNMMSDEQVKRAVRQWQLENAKGSAYAKALKYRQGK